MLAVFLVVLRYVSWPSARSFYTSIMPCNTLMLLVHPSPYTPNFFGSGTCLMTLLLIHLPHVAREGGSFLGGTPYA